MRPRHRRRRPARRAGAERRHRLGDGEHQHPRLRQAAARPAPDHDEPPRRRRPADPAGQVPRRAVRPPLRQPGQGRPTRPASDRRRPRAARTAAGEVDGAAEERRRHAAARPDQEDRGHRPAGQRPARHARPVVGQGRTPTPSRSSTASRPRTRHDVHPGLHPEQQRPAGLRPRARLRLRRRLRRRRSPPPRAPTRSCWRSARPAR